MGDRVNLMDLARSAIRNPQSAIYVCCLFALLMGVPGVLSADTGWIVGWVTDAVSGEPLPGAGVVLPEARMGAYADTVGVFRVEGVPEGQHRLEARMIGYRTAVVKVEVRRGAEVEARLALEPLPIHLQEMVVRAEADPAALAQRSPTFIRSIPSEVFEGKVVALPEVLSQVTGVQVKEMGGLGSYSTVSIRGTSAEQVKVYLDGIPLNSALGGGVNLGDIPLANVDRIEVYKGNAPARFGGGGIGGVVNILTKGVRGHTGNYAVTYGTFDTQKAHWMFSGEDGDLGRLIAVEYAKSDNDFSFLDDNGTKYNLNDDVWAHRRNNDFRSINLIGKVERRRWRGMDLSLHNNFYQSDKGAPGIGSFQSTFARLRTTRNTLEGRLSRRHLIRPWIQGSFEGFHSYYASDYRDLNGEVGLGKQDNHNVMTLLGGRAHCTALLAEYHRLTLVVERRRERFKPSDRFHNTPLLDNERSVYGWALEDELTLWRDRLNVTSSIQRDVYASRFFGDYTLGQWLETSSRKVRQVMVNRRIGLTYRISTGVTLKGNLGKYHRPPSFYELFGDKGSAIGNAELAPETGVNRDVGIRIDRAIRGRHPLFLEISGYWTRLEDTIQFVQYSTTVSKPENIGRAEIEGVEISVGGTVFDRVTAEANYTVQDARNRTELYGGIYRGKLLPNQPRYAFDARIEVFHPGCGRVFYAYSRSGHNFHDRYNTVPIPRRRIHTAGASVWRSRRGLRLTVEGRNLTDEQVADLWGYPLPGRSYYVTMRDSF